MKVRREKKLKIVDENDIFSQDILEYGSYVYTFGKKLSGCLATQRTAKIILAKNPFLGKSVLDIGCGDGFFSRLFYDRGKPAKWTGIDKLAGPIKLAQKTKKNRVINYIVGDAHKLPWPDNYFNLALIQSTLHHDNNPKGIIKEAFRVAQEVLIHEPNGNNPGLKLLEKVLKYHLKHHEKSYKNADFINWINHSGGKVDSIEFAGFVPMFCPDWLARIMKFLEPLVGKTPLIRKYLCAVTLISASKE